MFLIRISPTQPGTPYYKLEAMTIFNRVIIDHIFINRSSTIEDVYRHSKIRIYANNKISANKQ